MAIASALLSGLTKWEEAKAKREVKPWKVVSVDSGTNLTVAQAEKSKVIELCGIETVGEESQDYLESLIEMGDGSIELKRVVRGNENLYESWVRLAPGYGVELVSHISSEPDDLVDQESI